MARTGTGTTVAGLTRATVVEASVAADSFIGLSLSGELGASAGGAQVEYVFKVAGVGFILELSNAAQNSVAFDYIVL